MKILKRGKIVYYIKEESIKVGINNFQFLAFTVYPLQNRKPFYDFKKALLHSKENEYNTPTELLKLGQRFGLKAAASPKPTESDIHDENISS